MVIRTDVRPTHTHATLAETVRLGHQYMTWQRGATALHLAAIDTNTGGGPIGPPPVFATVEMGGVEPPSRTAYRTSTTRLVGVFMSRLNTPPTGQTNGKPDWSFANRAPTN
jgi:hypothetical protein